MSSKLTGIRESWKVEETGLLKSGMELWTKYKDISKSAYKTVKTTELLSHGTASQRNRPPPPYRKVNVYSLEKLNWKCSGLGTLGKGENKRETKDFQQGDYVKDHNWTFRLWPHSLPSRIQTSSLYHPWDWKLEVSSLRKLKEKTWGSNNKEITLQ